MGCECDFSWRVELVAFKKEGLAHMGKFMDNLLSRGKELSGNAYFRNPLDIRVNPRMGKREIFWKGYDRSISESMRRNAALLRLRGAPKDKIDQAKAGWQMWNQLQDTILNLEPDQAVRFLALRDLNPEDGMALQQISWQDGQLVLESQLLPSGELGQTENLVALVGEDREMIEMNMERAEGLSPLVMWAVKGRAIDFKQDLPVMIRESLSVNQEVGVPIYVIESMSEGAGADVHLGSGYEEVSVTEVPVYALPVVVRSQLVRQENLRIEEGITESTEATEGAELLPPHSRGGVEEVVGEKVVASQVMRLIPVGDEIRVAALQPVADRQVVEEVITENTEVTEGTEEVVAPMVTRMIPVSEEVAEITATELPKYEEITVSDVHLGSGHEDVAVVSNDFVDSVIERAFGKPAEYQERKSVKAESVDDRVEETVFSDAGEHVHLGSGHEAEEEVITEGAELKQKAQRLFFSDFSFSSVPLVIKETFDNKLAERKSVKSVKDKLIWLGRNIANILADQLMGRNTDEPVLGWLVHGWAMMQFDGIEEKQKMKRFSLSPVRIWADRVTGVARRVKDKFVRTYFSVYKQLFVAI